MNVINPIGDLRRIALSDLQLSPLNSRQTVSDEEIGAMAESIALCGLLQNLIGLERDGRVEIVGGGKRLRALQVLAAEGWRRKAGQKSIDPVPVLVTDDEHRAIAWSGAENTARTELSPADEIESYAALQARGSSVSMIAATFAVTEAHVQRRLRLARLPEPVLANLRAGRLSIDQARALTLAASDLQCVEILGTVLREEWPADHIRRTLTQDMVRADDRRVRWIGLDAYRAAGGAVTEDLFTDRAALHDAALLDRLFLEKGKAAAETLRAAEGWAEAHFRPDGYFDWNWCVELDQMKAGHSELPEADAEEYDTLALLAEAGDLTEAGLARLEDLERRMEPVWSDADLARGVIFCWVDRDATLQVRRGHGYPVRTADTGDADDTGHATPERPAKADAMPQNLIDDLRAVRLRAIQTALFGRHELLLDLLAFSLSADVRPWETPLAITTTDQRVTPEKTDGLNEDARFADPAPRGLDTPAPHVAWSAFRAKGKKHRNDVLTHALTRAWKLPIGPLADLVAAEISPDPRAIWTPTAAAYLGRLSFAALDTLWATLTPGPETDMDRTIFKSFKKAEKAKKLEKLFLDMDTREAMGLSRAENALIDQWLPPELRFEAGDEVP
jgi:ParB family transcriptional regulator, chromosome partitioning protein